MSVSGRKNTNVPNPKNFRGCRKIDENIWEYYTKGGMLGEGSYGTVYRATRK